MLVKNDAPKGWLLFGLIAGLALQNKLSMGFFGFGLCVALVLPSHVGQAIACRKP